MPAFVFAPLIRGALFGAGSPAVDPERLLRLEIQNQEHARLAGQIGDQADIIDGMQDAQAQLVVQVKVLAEVVTAMQKREFARLESRNNGI